MARGSGSNAAGLLILVDSSVWIDYFRGIQSPQTDRLDQLLDQEHICIGDLILIEVLQGFPTEKSAAAAQAMILELDVVNLGGTLVALEAAHNFRTLRHRGISVRKTIDNIIATNCILSGYTLLHNDRDFDPFVLHLGLQVLPESLPPAH